MLRGTKKDGWRSTLDAPAGAAERRLTMLVITLEVDAPEGMSLAIKEDLAMLVERYGDTRVVDVRVKEDKNGKFAGKTGVAR
jgi:hypothetical protein